MYPANSSVDDIVLTSDDVQGILYLNPIFHPKFETKDLGHLQFFVGAKVSRKQQSILLPNKKYVLDQN